MNIKLALQLDKLLEAGPNVFFYLVPEQVDFTSATSFSIGLMSKSNHFQVEVNKQNVYEVSSLLKSSVFEEGVTLIGWNLKNYFSANRFWSGGNFSFEGKLLDLKIAESFIGIHQKMPGDFDELRARVKVVVTNKSWDSFRNLSQKIYQPLFSQVLPAIECEGVFDKDNRRILYPFYEIEGQVNGRLSCSKFLKEGFNPHSLSDEEKKRYYPRRNDCTFLAFDYLHMEVSMLAWLSKDDALLDALGNGDFYKSLFKMLSGKEVETDTQRTFCKTLFLPVVYGQSSHSLAEKLEVSADTAKKIVEKLHKLFPKLFIWIENYNVEADIYRDYLGRCRTFEPGKEYKYRNFIVQAPSAVFCLEKLVGLYYDLGIYGSMVAHVHDGYLMRVEKKRVNEIETLVKSSLESESNIFPGLKLKVNSKISDTFA